MNDEVNKKWISISMLNMQHLIPEECLEGISFLEKQRGAVILSNTNSSVCTLLNSFKHCYITWIFLWDLSRYYHCKSE